MMNRKEFFEKTKGKKFVAVFIKKDGSERKMFATTSFAFIPEGFIPTSVFQKRKEVIFDEGDKVYLKEINEIFFVKKQKEKEGVILYECIKENSDKIYTFESSMIEKYSPYVNVFDLEANGWRKLNLETLKTLDLVKT